MWAYTEPYIFKDGNKTKQSISKTNKELNEPRYLRFVAWSDNEEIPYDMDMCPVVTSFSPLFMGCASAIPCKQKAVSSKIVTRLPTLSPFWSEYKSKYIEQLAGAFFTQYNVFWLNYPVSKKRRLPESKHLTGDSESVVNHLLVLGGKLSNLMWTWTTR